MTLLSTYFLELTKLEFIEKFVKNFHFTAIESNLHIVFLYKIKMVYQKKSYGISVASLSVIAQYCYRKCKKLIEIEIENI